MSCPCVCFDPQDAERLSCVANTRVRDADTSRYQHMEGTKPSKTLFQRAQRSKSPAKCGYCRTSLSLTSQRALKGYLHPMAPKAARRQGPFWLLRLAHQSEQPARRLRGRHRRGTLLLRGHTCAKKQGPPKFGQNGAEQTSPAPQDPRTPGAAPKCGQPRPTRRLGRAGTQAIPRPYPGHTQAIPRPYLGHTQAIPRPYPGHT